MNIFATAADVILCVALAIVVTFLIMGVVAVIVTILKLGVLLGFYDEPDTKRLDGNAPSTTPAPRYGDDKC